MNVINTIQSTTVKKYSLKLNRFKIHQLFIFEFNGQELIIGDFPFDKEGLEYYCRTINETEKIEIETHKINNLFRFTYCEEDLLLLLLKPKNLNHKKKALLN
jgi:hypothetical protein